MRIHTIVQLQTFINNGGGTLYIASKQFGFIERIPVSYDSIICNNTLFYISSNTITKKTLPENDYNDWHVFTRELEADACIGKVSASVHNDVVTLSMPHNVASVLLKVMFNIGGDPDKSHRKHTDAISRSLFDAGIVAAAESCFKKNYDCIYFENNN